MSNQEKAQAVLFLCTGNTCRSPLAAALARNQCDCGQIEFLSAGLHAYPGQPASAGSLRVATEHGLSLADFRSRALDHELLREVDWIIAMTRSHVALFKQRFTHYRGAIGLLGAAGIDLAARTATPDVEEVADPHTGTLDDYRAMATQLVRLLAGWRTFFQQRSEIPGG